MKQDDLARGIEAILFALGEPVPSDKLGQALEAETSQVRAACEALVQDYETRQAGIRLIRLEDSWQLVSDPQWGDAVRRLLERKKPDKLSPAALETLAIVAYFQPVTRVYLDQVRGVDCSHSLSLLLDRELVAPCGTLDAPGRPILYETTPDFLRAFGLASLEDLPPLPEQGQKEEGGTGP
ncbi:MAG: SMC-Scp complex subunit ScpB [Evtepia sp.]